MADLSQISNLGVLLQLELLIEFEKSKGKATCSGFLTFRSPHRTPFGVLHVPWAIPTK